MCYSIINFPNCLAKRKVNNYIQVVTANINYSREFEDAYMLRPSTLAGEMGHRYKSLLSKAGKAAPKDSAHKWVKAVTLLQTYLSVSLNECEERRSHGLNSYTGHLDFYTEVLNFTVTEFTQSFLKFITRVQGAQVQYN